MTQEYILRSASNTTADKQLYKKCFDNNGSPRDINKIEWLLFNQTPLWINFAIPSTNENSTAAIIAALPCKFKYFNENVYTGQFLDTMTDKEHRGKGLFVKLVKHIYPILQNSGCKIAWGFPNANAAHGWFNKLNWKEIDTVPFMIKPLRTSYIKKVIKNKFINFLIPNINLKFLRFNLKYRNEIVNDVAIFDDSYDRLWEDFSNNINIAIIRNAAYLNWRYVNKPNENYIIKAITKDNSVLAFVVYCLKEKHNGKIGYIMEIMHAKNCEHNAINILNYAINDLNQKGCEIMLCWSFKHSSTYKIYKKCGFFTLPKKLQFIKMHFGAFNLSNADDRVYNSKNWFLSYSDSDTV